MQLTLYTDYSLRVLLYLALKPPGELATVSEIADSYGVSRNHLVKVVHNLATLGFIESVRGKGGGLRLAIDPARVTIAEVASHTEPNFDLVECFRRDGSNSCPITPVCRLKAMLEEARQRFFEVLAGYTLADAAGNAEQLSRTLRIAPAGKARGD